MIKVLEITQKILQIIEESKGDDDQLVADMALQLVSALPAGARAIKLPELEAGDIQIKYIGNVRAIRAYDPVMNKVFIRADLGYQ